MTKKLDELLKFDATLEAEKITGVEYKPGKGFDKETLATAIALLQDNIASRNEILMDLNDTLLENELSRYLFIIEKYGFEKVLEEDFGTKHFMSDETTYEKYYIYVHRKKGLLLSFDTYTWTKKPPRLNGGNVYYQWKPFVDNWAECISSGGFIRGDIWSGHHDCREALIHNLTKLDNRGEFVVPWVERPALWLINYGDEEKKDPKYDHKKLVNERIARLPEWVQTMIGPERE